MASSDDVNQPVVALSESIGSGPHLRWELQQLLSRIRPEDLSLAEISRLLNILIPAHCRVLGIPMTPLRSERR